MLQLNFLHPVLHFSNICKCLNEKVPVVSGTTGWLENYDEAVEICKKT